MTWENYFARFSHSRTQGGRCSNTEHRVAQNGSPLDSLLGAGLQTREVRDFEEESTRRRDVGSTVDAFHDGSVAEMGDGAGHEFVRGEEVAEHAALRAVVLRDGADEELRVELIRVAQVDDVHSVHRLACPP